MTLSERLFIVNIVVKFIKIRIAKLKINEIIKQTDSPATTSTSLQISVDDVRSDGSRNQEAIVSAQVLNFKKIMPSSFFIEQN